MHIDKITEIGQEIIEEHPTEVARWKNGEKGMMKFLSDKLVIKTFHKANPKLAIVVLTRLMSGKNG